MSLRTKAAQGLLLRGNHESGPGQSSTNRSQKGCEDYRRLATAITRATAQAQRAEKMTWSNAI